MVKENCVHVVRHQWIGLAVTVGPQTPRVLVIDRFRGFTLIEMLMVIVILMIAAMSTLPMMSAAGSIQLDVAGDMLVADLSYARSMAISRGQYYAVSFDPAGETYQVEDQTGTVIKHPVSKQDYIVDFPNNSRVDLVKIDSANFDGTQEIRFDYLGSPYNAGNNPLNSGQIVISGNAQTRTISIEPVTGVVSVSP